MKIAEYNQMMAYLTRQGFQSGTPKPKPGRTLEDKLRTLKSVSQGISPESRIRLLDYFIQEALTKGQLTEEQASGIYNQLREDKDKIRKQIDDYETGNFNDPFRTTREDFAVGALAYAPTAIAAARPLVGPLVRKGAEFLGGTAIGKRLYDTFLNSYFRQNKKVDLI